MALHDFNADPILLEPDSDIASEPSETDSALGDDISLLSSTASMRSSIMMTREENGRKYHAYKEGKYVLPTDEEELDRQEYQYSLCLATFGQLSFAPFANLHRVLDIGCGLGFWTIDFAEKHPEAEVLGVDLSPVQPAYVPPNSSFEIDDLEEEWTFSFDFDYIHCQMMTGAFRDWPRFYRQAYQFLRPDGWLELQDISFPLKCDDASLPEDSALKKWNDHLVEAGRLSGFRLDHCTHAARMLREAGFVDVVTIPYKWPMGTWPKDPHHKRLGSWVLNNFTAGVEGISLALFTRYLGWTKEEVTDFARDVARDFQNRHYHTYFDMYVTYGRKGRPGEGFAPPV